ncbi:cysteine--tRNA ligase, partial [bacterium]|nr:cysteine--tRNA ligase [bacterium]
FQPREAGKVGLYTCGPTVYKDATIGNFRTYIFEDLLRRTLEFIGYEVTQVMNITDVDDKTIREAHSRDVPLSEITEPVIEHFFRDLALLKIERAEYYPHATEHIPEMIELVQRLHEGGYAYKKDGSVYFSVSSYPKYGKLSGMKLESLARGVRIDADEYEKEDFRDFALWKGWTEEDGEVGWDSPFGRGRPGWHIECSAMSRKYLGEEFDLHTGGVDNIFPHHENELAQSVAATGRKFVRYWMHSAHLMVEGEKMSKSLGNVYTIQDLLDKGYSMRAVRYVLLTTHYRQQLNFTDEAIKAAYHSIERLDTLVQAAESANGDGEVRSVLAEYIEIARKGFTDALLDDLGISEAMAALFNLVSSVHRLTNEIPLNRAEGSVILDFWKDVDRALGLLIAEDQDIPEDIYELILKRIEYRANRDFKMADKIRLDLENQGYQLEDLKGETVVIWHGGRKTITKSF